ncbi:MAG: hypothetical protein WDM71_04770 [Ferruginibacter sp.]
MLKFKEAAFIDKVWLLFSQHNEHRILLDRIMFVLDYYIFGSLNFKYLIIIADLELVVIFLILISFIRKCIPKYWNICALIVAFCLFDLGNYENADWAMAGIQNYGVIMLFLLSLFFYNRNGKWAIVAAVFFQFMLVFSSGNGVVGCAVILLFTILQKDKSKIIIAAIASIIFISLYFLHYQQSQTPRGTFDTTIPFFFKLSGAIISFDYAAFFGVVILALTFFTLPATKKINFKENTLPLVVTLVFVLGTMCTISYFRSNFSKESKDWFHGSKYLIYPHILLAVCFVFSFLKMKEKKFKWPVTIAFALIIIFVYQQNMEWGESGFARENLRLTSKPYYGVDEKVAKEIEQKACAENIYCAEDADMY